MVFFEMQQNARLRILHRFGDIPELAQNYKAVSTNKTNQNRAKQGK